MELSGVLFVYSFSVIWLIFVVQGTPHILVPDDELIFRACQPPDHLYFAESVDFSDIRFQTFDENIQIEGSIQFLWELDPTDNIEIKMQAFRRRAGSYQPTVLNVIKKDGCKALFNPDEIWYNSLTSHVETKICPTAEPKVVWKFTPFNVSAILDINGDEEGKYKITVNLLVYDNKDRYKKERFCGEVHGELYKM